MRFGRREGFMQRSRCMSRQIVEHDADFLDTRIVEVNQVTHAFGKVAAGALLRHLDLAPRVVGIKEDKQVYCPVTAVFAVVASWPGAAGTGGRIFPISCVELSSKQTTGCSGSAASA